MDFEVPPCVTNLYQDREELRSLRERALLLVRRYNRSDGRQHTTLASENPDVLLTPVFTGLSGSSGG